MRLIIALAAFLLALPARADMYPDASNAKLPEARVNLGLDGLNTLSYPARNYGSCTWDATHDVGACINLAIAAAAAAGGGEVVIPAGTYGISVPLVQNTSGVKLQGAGAGILGSSALAPGTVVAPTELAWIGAAAAGPMLDVASLTAATIWVQAADITGIMFDCRALLDICVRIQDVTHSTFDFAQSEARKTGILFTTNNLPAGAVGNQYNTARLWFQNFNASYAATGVVFDRGTGMNVNTSLNNFEYLNGAYGAGDGVVFCASDNNTIGNTVLYHRGTATSGTPVVMANLSGYTPPSGVPCNGYSRGNTILRTSDPITIQGHQTGSTFVARPGNTGTGAVNAKTYSTNALTASPSNTLPFASTTGVVNGESIHCGGASSGVYPYSIVGSVAPTSVVMRQLSVYGGLVTQIPSGLSCTFTYGVTPSSVPGVYVLSTADGTNFTLTAPAGGHTQSGIKVVSGALRFTDMVIPWTGTALAGDAWDITLYLAPSQIVISYVDKDNGVSAPHCEYGADGSVAGGVPSTTIKTCGLSGQELTAPLSVSYYMPNESILVPALSLENSTRGEPTAAGHTVLSFTRDGVAKGQIRVNNAGSMILEHAGESITLGNSTLGYAGLSRVNFGDTSRVTHLTTAQGLAPALTSCGGGTPAIAGTDVAGTVTMGTSATGCIITFRTAYTGTPHCVVTWVATPLASQSYATSPTALTLTQTSTSGNVAKYLCLGPSGG